MNIFRTTVLVLVAALIPGGLILLVPLVQRWVNETRNRSRRSKEELTPGSSGSQG